jgi:hypothetical protein
MYKLTYYLGGRLLETVVRSAPYGVCKWRMNEIKDSSHKMGTLKIERVWVK